MPTSFAGVPVVGANDVPRDYGRWLIHGPQGSGKTTLAATIAEVGPTLFIDLIGEHGTRSFQGSPWAKNITVIRPSSVTKLDDIYWALAKGGHGYKAVVLDSATAMQKLAMRYLMGYSETAVREIANSAAPADFKTWGQAGDIMIDLATFWYGLADADRSEPMHVVITAQTKVKENDEGQSVRTPDVQPAALSILLAAPDYVLYTDVEDNPDAIGDDSLAPVHHIVRFGSDPEYRIKARIPYEMRGKVPPILGRSKPTSLVSLSRVLGVGGIPTRTRKTAATPTSATAETQPKEQ